MPKFISSENYTHAYTSACFQFYLYFKPNLGQLPIKTDWKKKKDFH